MLCVLLSGCASNAPSVKLSEIIGPRAKAKSTDTKLQKVNELLRSKYCKELFLRFGIDASNDGPRNAQEAHQACVDDDLSEDFPVDSFSIALSGGGPRSASFSMGVLKALNREGYLAELNSVSSVSGGGYTAYWYFMQRYHWYLFSQAEKKTDAVIGPVSGHYARELERMRAFDGDLKNYSLCREIDKSGDELDAFFAARIDGDIFEDDFYQAHLARQSDIVNYATSPTIQKLETTGLLASHVASLPLYWLTDGVFNTGIYNGSVLTNAYRKGLERTYGLAPNTAYSGYIDYFQHQPRQYLNARRGSVLFWRQAAQTDELSFKDLRDFLLAYNACADALSNEERAVPPLAMPIVNATLSRPYSLFKDDNNFDAQSLEKSVFSFTPLTWGSAFTDYADEAYLHAPVQLSKAIAISGAAADKEARELSGIADFGISLINLNLGYNIRNPKYQHDANGTIWFWAYKVLGGFPLRLFLRENWHATLRLSDGGHSENLGLYSLIERGTRRIVVVDAEYDAGYRFDGLRRIREKLSAELNLELECATNCPLSGDYMHAQGPAVFRLKVNNFPGGSDASGQRPIHILYIKLSIDERKVMPSVNGSVPSDQCLRSGAQEPDGKYYCNVARYYEAERDNGVYAFPHNSTADIWYSEEQYAAYRDLAYYIGITEVNPVVQCWIEEVRTEREAMRARVKGYLNGQDNNRVQDAKKAPRYTAECPTF